MPADYAARPKKSLGQHFLVDEQVIDDLAALINPGADDHMVEIGPGPGALTSRLAGRVRRLDLVELDSGLAAQQRETYAGDPSVTVYEQDVLTFDLAALNAAAPVRVCGNLPYNISTPLLLKLAGETGNISDMTFMVQREVAARVAAPPGGKDYGRLSVMVQYHCAVELAFDVAPEAFRPPPRVVSSVITLRPRPPVPAAHDFERFSDVVRIAFAQRRKTLRNALKTVFDADAMAAIGIDPAARPETLAVADYVALANLPAPRG